MIGGLFRALQRLPVWARRPVMVALPLLLLAAVVAAFALAPNGPGRSSRPAASSAQLLPPSSTTATATGARPARPAAKLGQSSAAPRSGQSHRSRKRPGAARRRPVRGPVSEEPPPPSPHSAERMILAAARRFAIAYMPYQLGQVPGWVRTAIKATCTPAFGRYLLEQPTRLTAQQVAHPKVIETYRAASVEPAAAPHTVLVRYVSEQDSADTGEFLLRLTKQHGRWLVAQLET